ncbi:MAG: lytic murein transglycosylase B [Pseudomonadales bacterium]
MPQYFPTQQRYTALATCFLLCAMFFAGLLSANESAGKSTGDDVERRRHAFITEVSAKHHISTAELSDLLGKAVIKDDILAAISKPVERTYDWTRYKKIFIQDSRIEAGRQFMLDNAPALTRAEERWGVPAEIITAIIGVETKYGNVMGNHRVIDALATLAFAYPKRAKFFRKELEHFLLLAREQRVDPLQPLGSYAGAMGYGQFMPSSYRSYAVDFDGDGTADIWNNKTDAIGSVANYFAEHGWREGGVARIALTRNNRPVTLAVLNNSLKPNLRAAQLPAFGFDQPERLSNEAKVALFRFKSKQGPRYVVGLKNFYVITRYNHSRLYAMAVLELSERIAVDPGSGT